MRKNERVIFCFVLLLLVVVIGLNFYAKHFIDNSSFVLQKSQSNLLTGAVVGTDSVVAFSSLVPSSGPVECWSFKSQTTCNNNVSLGCKWNTFNSVCDRYHCYNADGTNQTFCETTLKTFNQSCTWTGSFCNPIGGGFFGSGCSDFNGNSQGCFNTNFCIWNSSVSTCLNPVGGVSGQVGGSNNPSCSVIVDQQLCNGISGCSWDTGLSLCSGNSGGMSCSLLNKTTCPELTLLSTCCNWNGTNCTSSFDKGCYTTKTAPTGGAFCEDFKAYNNETLCNQIAGSPWYMPCKWNNVTNQCHFNSVSFGSSSKMGEISTEAGCSAAGGSWKSNSYTSDATTKTDSWCEFNFGFKGGSASGSGNCDTACWACETGVSSSKGNSSAQAQSFCENSALGYCEFRADTNAPNKLGFCNPRQTFMDAGGKSCKSDCAACDFLNNPQSNCQNSTKGCVFATDTSAPNGKGFCYGKSEKYCANDCFSCYDQATCKSTGNGGNGACYWDSANAFCKPSGYTGEICFDGVDNDNNGKIDCADPACSSDKYCGGADLSEGFGKDCPSFTSQGEAACGNGGCSWTKDRFQTNFGGAGAGFCDFPGTKCKNYDDSSSCTAENGCSWVTSGISSRCDKNSTLFTTCFLNTTQQGCLGLSGCGWTSDSFNPNGGRCEPVIYSQCFNNASRFTNQTSCEQNSSYNGVSTKICSWTSTSNNQGGTCGPVCNSLSVGACPGWAGLCKVFLSGLCQPTSFGGKCSDANGNKTYCTSTLNASCSFFADSLANNGNTTEKGWCKSKNEAKMFNFMGDKAPIILGDDGDDATINDTWDLRQMGLRDDFENFVIGSTVGNFSLSAACNGTPFTGGFLGYGKETHVFLWNLDTDGNTTNGCTARDNSSLTGFEFSFYYMTQWSSAFSEKKVSYQCVNGTWAATPIPFVANREKMCILINGGMAGISKKELLKFKTLYNKSKDLRIYSTLGNNSANQSIVIDTAGPYYYSPGSFDFKFEDCSDPGADADGDGLTAANDPDCFNFMKFGYVPMENGFQCGDNQDNDGDGKTDCADEGCIYEPVCGGSGLPVANANDKTAPKLVWFQADTFPDSAFIKYDTNEPANGTVLFYNLDNTCTATNLNMTIRDRGLIDAVVPDYRLFHDGSIDNFQFNIDKLPAPLVNATTYFYQTKVCDINGNCAVSACLNFTTKASLLACKTCSSTFTFPFTPRSGVGATDPLGSLAFKFEYALGGTSTVDPNAGVGISTNLTQSKYFNLVIENTNATNASRWRFKLINATVSGKVSTSVQNFTGGSDIQFNATSNSTSRIPLVGLSTSKCQEVINAFHPAKIEIGIPGNNTGELWQCNTGSLTNCTNRASNATILGYNTTLNMTSWLVPAEWGC